jgi:alkylation response protein AidB-like acyl-CoA dehydrogenase
MMTAEPSVDVVERAFGDPWDDANPVGFAALLEADERQEMPAAGEDLLDAVGLNAEFVPVGLGGRFTQMDRLAEVMRAVFRHDPCLGLGYGASSFIAAVNVWASGDATQQRVLADLLLAGRKVAAAFHELDHGNDFSRAEFAATRVATRTGTGWRLNGRKEVIANLHRASALVLFARTSLDSGSRSHSQFFVPTTAIDADAVRYLPRFRSSGMRGVPLGGAEFTDCDIPADCLLGREGQGIETALCSFQLTRSAFPAMLAGCLDTGLRAAAGCASDRRLYGGTAADLPQVRAVLADAFADLLIVDSFCTVVTRALHVLPEQTPVFASAVKYLVSGLLMDAMDALAAVLGAQSYLRDGPYAIFGKQARDLPPAGFGHASRAACLVTMLPQLPRLARHAWLTAEAAPATLFRLGTGLAPLDFGRLVAGGDGTDGLAGSLLAIDQLLAPPGGAVGRLTALFAAELADLAEASATLRPRDLTIDSSPAARKLAARYATVLAAAACVSVWWHNSDHPSAFLRDDVWVIAALHRLARRLGRPSPINDHEAEAVTGALAREVLARHREQRAFDLSNRELPG